jgi:hypothetical protein
MPANINRTKKYQAPISPVPDENQWGRQEAVKRTQAQGYGAPKYQEGVVWDTPNPQKPQKLGDRGNQQDNARGYYDNDVANDWRRGAGGGAESATGKPDFDRMRHVPKPTTATEQGGLYRAGEVPSRFHAHDPYGRMGAGRGRISEDPANSKGGRQEIARGPRNISASRPGFRVRDRG